MFSKSLLVFCAGSLATVSGFGGPIEHDKVQLPVIEKEHTYMHGNTELHGYLMYQDNGETDRAGLLVFPYFMGAPALPDRDVGRGYAEKGMVVFVADYYGKDYNPDVMAQVQEALQGTYPGLMADYENAHKIALLGLEQLTSIDMVSDEKIGVLGFCAGGEMASNLVRAGGKAKVAISFHGNAAPAAGDNVDDDENHVDYFAAFYGLADPLIPAEARAGSREWLAGAFSDTGDYEVTTYGKTAHGFSVAMPDGVMAFIDSIGFGGAAAYSEKRSKSAFARADALFQEHGLLHK
jgi:dienelactone hydrolase